MRKFSFERGQKPRSMTSRNFEWLDIYKFYTFVDIISDSENVAKLQETR